MKRCSLGKIASVTARNQLSAHAILGHEIPAQAGTIVAARVLNAKTQYNRLEDVHGRLVTLHPGDVIAGALGHRNALHGFSGSVPNRLQPGDEVQLLNAGGVLGTGAVATPGIGEPFRLEVLGVVLDFPHLDRRVGTPASVQGAALPLTPLKKPLPPIITLVGTCMNSGKTTAASALIGELARQGLSVAAGKLTGVSLRQDVLHMQDCGAFPVAIFTDFGIVTTDESNALPAAHALIGHLAEADPDVIVLEMGDGLLGTYGVHAILADDDVRHAIRATVLCAQDPVGAWGGQRLLSGRYGLGTDVVTGPVTDSAAGLSFCHERLSVQAFNALRDPAALIRALPQQSLASFSPQEVEA